MAKQTMLSTFKSSSRLEIVIVFPTLRVSFFAVMWKNLLTKTQNILFSNKQKHDRIMTLNSIRHRDFNGLYMSKYNRKSFPKNNILKSTRDSFQLFYKTKRDSNWGSHTFIELKSKISRSTDQKRYIGVITPIRAKVITSCYRWNHLLCLSPKIKHVWKGFMKNDFSSDLRERVKRASSGYPGHSTSSNQVLRRCILTWSSYCETRKTSSFARKASYMLFQKEEQAAPFGATYRCVSGAMENHVLRTCKSASESIANNTVFWNFCFDKGRLKNIVLWFLKIYGENRTIQLVEELKNVGFDYATKAGISLGIDDLKIPQKKSFLLFEAEKIATETVNQYKKGEITGVERYQRLIDTWHRTSEILKQEVIENFIETDILNPVYMMAFSGARGNISQVRQLVGMRGLMADPKGQILDFPIRSNFREGLTLTEYIISSYGARKGIVDTALRTANAGYLTRRLVDVAQHVIISNFDCGTRKGIFLNDMKEGNKTIHSLQTRLVGRILGRDLISQDNPNMVIASRNDEISADLAFTIAQKFSKVFVRSPLTCETKKLVCQLCYGWSLAQGNLVSIGEAIGVVAAQSIGEPGTQLTMRTFHTGGVFSGDISEQIKAPFDGIIQYTAAIPGTLIRTPEGKIAFLTKSDGSFVVKYSDSNEQNKVSKKYKIPSYTLLFLRNGSNVQEKEVLAQITNIRARNKNATDVAELTIKSELEGQFILRSLILREKKIGPKPTKSNKQEAQQVSDGTNGENTALSDVLRSNIVFLKETPLASQERLRASGGSLRSALLDLQANQKELSEPEEKSEHSDLTELVYEAWTWGNAWILAGKIYQLNIPSSFFPFKGDFISRSSFMNRVNWNSILHSVIGGSQIHLELKSRKIRKRPWAPVAGSIATPLSKMLAHAGTNKLTSKSLRFVNGPTELVEQVDKNKKNSLVLNEALALDLEKIRFHKLTYFLKLAQKTKTHLISEKDVVLLLRSLNCAHSECQRYGSPAGPSTNRSLLDFPTSSRMMKERGNPLSTSNWTMSFSYLLKWFPEHSQTKTGGLIFRENSFANSGLNLTYPIAVKKDKPDVKKRSLDKKTYTTDGILFEAFRPINLWFDKYAHHFIFNQVSANHQKSLTNQKQGYEGNVSSLPTGGGWQNSGKLLQIRGLSTSKKSKKASSQGRTKPGLSNQTGVPHLNLLSTAHKGELSSFWKSRHEDSLATQEGKLPSFSIRRAEGQQSYSILKTTRSASHIVLPLSSYQSSFNIRWKNTGRSLSGKARGLLAEGPDGAHSEGSTQTKRALGAKIVPSLGPVRTPARALGTLTGGTYKTGNILKSTFYTNMFSFKQLAAAKTKEFSSRLANAIPESYCFYYTAPGGRILSPYGGEGRGECEASAESGVRGAHQPLGQVEASLTKQDIPPEFKKFQVRQACLSRLNSGWIFGLMNPKFEQLIRNNLSQRRLVKKPELIGGAIKASTFVTAKGEHSDPTGIVKNKLTISNVQSVSELLYRPKPSKYRKRESFTRILFIPQKFYKLRLLQKVKTTTILTKRNQNALGPIFQLTNRQALLSFYDCWSEHGLFFEDCAKGSANGLFKQKNNDEVSLAKQEEVFLHRKGKPMRAVVQRMTEQNEVGKALASVCIAKHYQHHNKTEGSSEGANAVRSTSDRQAKIAKRLIKISKIYMAHQKRYVNYVQKSLKTLKSFCYFSDFSKKTDPIGLFFVKRTIENSINQMITLERFDTIDKLIKPEIANTLMLANAHADAERLDLKGFLPTHRGNQWLLLSFKTRQFSSRFIINFSNDYSIVCRTYKDEVYLASQEDEETCVAQEDRTLRSQTNLQHESELFRLTHKEESSSGRSKQVVKRYCFYKKIYYYMVHASNKIQKTLLTIENQTQHNAYRFGLGRLTLLNKNILYLKKACDFLITTLNYPAIAANVLNLRTQARVSSKSASTGSIVLRRFTSYNSKRLAKLWGAFAVRSNIDSKEVTKVPLRGHNLSVKKGWVVHFVNSKEFKNLLPYHKTLIYPGQTIANSLCFDNQIVYLEINTSSGSGLGNSSKTAKQVNQPLSNSKVNENMYSFSDRSSFVEKPSLPSEDQLIDSLGGVHQKQNSFNQTSARLWYENGNNLALSKLWVKRRSSPRYEVNETKNAVSLYEDWEASVGWPEGNRFLDFCSCSKQEEDYFVLLIRKVNEQNFNTLNDYKKDIAMITATSTFDINQVPQLKLKLKKKQNDLHIALGSGFVCASSPWTQKAIELKPSTTDASFGNKVNSTVRLRLSQVLLRLNGMSSCSIGQVFSSEGARLSETNPLAKQKRTKFYYFPYFNSIKIWEQNKTLFFNKQQKSSQAVTKYPNIDFNVISGVNNEGATKKERAAKSDTPSGLKFEFSSNAQKSTAAQRERSEYAFAKYKFSLVFRKPLNLNPLLITYENSYGLEYPFKHLKTYFGMLSLKIKQTKSNRFSSLINSHMNSKAQIYSRLKHLNFGKTNSLIDNKKMENSKALLGLNNEENTGYLVQNTSGNGVSGSSLRSSTFNFVGADTALAEKRESIGLNILRTFDSIFELALLDPCYSAFLSFSLNSKYFTESSTTRLVASNHQSFFKNQYLISPLCMKSTSEQEVYARDASVALDLSTVKLMNRDTSKGSFLKTNYYSPFEGEILFFGERSASNMNSEDSGMSSLANTPVSSFSGGNYQSGEYRRLGSTKLQAQFFINQRKEQNCLILTKKDCISYYLTTRAESYTSYNKVKRTQTNEHMIRTSVKQLINESEKYKLNPANYKKNTYKKISDYFQNKTKQSNYYINDIVIALDKMHFTFPSVRKFFLKSSEFSLGSDDIADKTLAKINNLSVGIPQPSNKLQLGDFVAYGDNINENMVIQTPGQIIHINNQKITIRKGQPIIISPKAILHKYNGDFIEKKTPVITLSYQQLKTGDIIQGIPKVEQFFEARTTKRGRLFRDSLPNLLKGLYNRYSSLLPQEQAVRQSFYKIQQIIVDGVQRVYKAQGVTIADKHLEVIVKQMTCKVRILDGAQTGFFPGEIVDIELVEKINSFLMKKITYEPIVLGITRASLEVDSFLSAASFQQTTRVLSKAAIGRKKDFLKGLKENIMLGNLMPAGTGYLVSISDKR